MPQAASAAIDDTDKQLISYNASFIIHPNVSGHCYGDYPSQLKQVQTKLSQFIEKGYGMTFPVVEAQGPWQTIRDVPFFYMKANSSLKKPAAIILILSLIHI